MHQTNCCISSCICLAKSNFVLPQYQAQLSFMWHQWLCPILGTLIFFQSLEEVAWRAKGWVVGFWTRLFSFNKPVTLSELDWSADEQPYCSHSAEILPCHHFHGKLLPLELCLKPWESPVWGSTETKHLPARKGKKKDELQWKCCLKITDPSHQFR